MRYVPIDLSSDNYLQQPQIFAGYEGEHNETILLVKLPDRLLNINYTGYRFDFQTSEDNKISSPLIPVDSLKNGVLSFSLSEQITIAGKLLFNIVGILLNGDTVNLVSKTNMIVLYIGNSPDGKSVLLDPSGYKDEVLTMIDNRIKDAIFIPHVSSDGIISWSNDMGLDNPVPVNIKGSSGVYLGSGEMPEDCNVQIDPNGEVISVDDIVNNYANSTANALKGKKAGKIVTVNDVSPIEHTVSVKLSSDTITDFSSVKVTRCGKNIFDADTVLPTLTNENFPGWKWTKQDDGSWHLGNVGTLVGCKWFENTSGYIGQMAISITGRVHTPVENSTGLLMVIKYTDNTTDTLQMPCSEEFVTKTLVSNPNKIISHIYQSFSSIVDPYIKDIMLSYGTNTEYEPYSPYTVTANADGTVDLTSISPNMTLSTDTDGVNIDLQYNRDINKPLQFEKIYDGIIQNVTFDKPYTELYVKYETMMGLEADVTVLLDNGEMPFAYFWGAEMIWYHLKFDGGLWNPRGFDSSGELPLDTISFYLGATAMTKFLISSYGEVDNTTDTLTIYAR